MLSKILDNTMERAARYENITRASKFSRSYKSAPQNKNEITEALMLKKIANYTKPEAKKLEKNGETNQITENPQSKIPVLKPKSLKKTGLPFFRSIEYKLSMSK